MKSLHSPIFAFGDTILLSRPSNTCHLDFDTSHDILGHTVQAASSNLIY